MLPWPAIIFGWPAVGVAVAAFALAFITRAWLAIVGAAVAAPFCLFVTLYPFPIGRVGGPLALIGNISAAYLMTRKRPVSAALCLAPFVIVATVFAIIVLNQSRSLLR